jgi:NarL family two-component system response regulator LiaR
MPDRLGLMMQQDEPITVMVIDDHAVVRRGVRVYLDSQPDLHVVGEAGDGKEAIEMIAGLAPDVAFVDLVMPGMDGVEVTRQIKRVSPTTRVVVLTSYHQDEQIFPAIRAGALSYLLKDIKPEELAEAARKASRGEAVLHPQVAARVMRELHGSGHGDPNSDVQLTDRELEVLQHIADGSNNATIAERLFISEKTVKRHVSNILGKLHLSDRTQAAVYAWRKGIVRRD